MKKDELIKWLNENKNNFNGGYIKAYENEYVMKTFIDSQYMDLEFEFVGVNSNSIRFLAPDGFPASYTLDFKDILNSTGVQIYDGYFIKCKYFIQIKLRGKRIF